MSGTPNLSRVERLKRRHRTRRGNSLIAAIVAVVVLVTAGTALAFFNTTADGNAAAQAGSLVTPAPSAVVTGAGQITISWSTSGQPTGTLYTVTRTSPSSAPICASVSAGSCVDNSVTQGTNYQYSVVASLHLWQAAGNTSAISSAGNATHLAFGQQPSNAAAGVSMSPSPTVRILDQYNNLTSTTSSVALTITTNSCGGSPTVSGGTVNAVAGTATFAGLQIIKACTGYKLTATDAADGNLTVVSNTFNITAGTATKLAFTTQPVAGAASGGNPTLGPITVEQEDASGNPVNAGVSGLVVTLSSTGAGTARFAATSGSSTGINSVTIPNGSSSANFYYRNSASGTPIVTASNSGLTSATQTELIGLHFTFTSSAVSGAASSTANLGPITVQLRNSSNSGVNPGAPLTVNLSSNSTGTAVFALTSGGSTVTSVDIPGGSSSASFFYGDTKAGGPSITASVSGITSTSQTETITALTANKLVIATAPVAGAASAGNATIGPITVQQQDTLGNPVNAGVGGLTIGLSSTSGTAKFATSSGGSSVASVTIPNGSSSVNFYYGDNTNGTPTITASHSPLAAASQVELIGGKFVITSSAISGVATSSPTLGPITVQLQTSAGVPVTTGATVGLSSSSPGTATFSLTSGGSLVSSVAIPSGSSTVDVFYGDTKAGSPVITASATGIASASQTETISAGAAAGLSFTNVSTNSGATTATCNGTVGSTSFACTLTTESGNAVSGRFMTANVTLIDQNQNVVTNSSGSPITVTLTQSGIFTGPVSSPVSIPDGSSTSSTTFTESLPGLIGTQGTVTASATVNATSVQAKITS